ncbi:MAG: dienelactone hydrolase, partial [Pseudomonadota bacterium]
MKHPARLCVLVLASALPFNANAQDTAAVEPVFNSETVGDTLPGAFLTLPSGNGPHPAIIVLGGSEGSDSAARTFTKRFVPQGYAVLGLPYYGP